MEILQQQVQAQSKEADVLVIPCGSMEDARKGVEAQAPRIYNSTWWPVGNGAMEKDNRNHNSIGDCRRALIIV